WAGPAWSVELLSVELHRIWRTFWIGWLRCRGLGYRGPNPVRSVAPCSVAPDMTYQVTRMKRFGGTGIARCAGDTAVRESSSGETFRFGRGRCIPAHQAGQQAALTVGAGGGHTGVLLCGVLVDERVEELVEELAGHSGGAHDVAAAVDGGQPPPRAHRP